MVIAMVLNGPPSTYETFSTVVKQREKEMTFQEFKKSLMNHEESDKTPTIHSSVEERRPPPHTQLAVRGTVEQWMMTVSTRTTRTLTTSSSKPACNHQELKKQVPVLC